MQSTAYRLIEFFIAFVLIPLSFTLDIPIGFKLSSGLIGFVYVIFVLLRVEKLRLIVGPDLNWKRFFKRILVQLFGIVILTTLYVWFFDKDQLFIVLLNKPLLWLMILFIYSFFSVYPQELIYRTFFFSRYNSVFKDPRLLMFINAIVFSLGHIFFRNALVMVLTFVGGLLFAFTFQKTKSTLLVTVEHAIYGSWLFTVGMGNMLGFPS
ncbi:type II CAAX endopeptidase family protein [Psychroserpens sp.]|uniref:CPBP family intramembrane glutamic endopeptidase n=1 Tax=Psychroserpens sp. TaxID=2020870 RepID=UPI001AFE3591|nr:type II CAAX endopeptidase family protein [Psychroserpens sp.]MBO6606743.1 CPBP family intramembrane metalloprotease [Psychroserpens sp.]MBO6631782.1 CPBP family intramembrane metalloprotease [Psychroserpens sp.]MBO6653446.1 CPBP family intramembrane metalloprotease [Psychroserpens sp.]MBO6680526.1 CPBP family intramembrane metalloprotease [Psychroserpens sp.]MBO6750515.1 CPBP family intramembrane metalloprotease [Psychroserpens sp.]